MGKNDRMKGTISIILAGFFSVLLGVVVRFLNPYFTLYQQIYIRLFTAFIIGFFVFGSGLSFGKLAKLPKKEWILIMFRSAIGFLFGAPLWVAGFASASLANATFLDSFPMTVFLGFLILRERIYLKKVLYILIAFTGVLLITIKDFSLMTGWGKGEILVFASTVFFAIRSISRKWHLRLLNDQEITQLLHFFGFIFLFFASLVLGEGLPAFSVFNINVFLFTIAGGFFNVMILFFLNRGFSFLDASDAGNISQIAPLFAIVVGFILYNEIPSLRSLFGGSLIIIGVMLTNRMIAGKYEKT